MADQIPLEIFVNVEKALSSFKNFEEKSTKSLESVEKTLQSIEQNTNTLGVQLKGAFVGAVSAIAATTAALGFLDKAAQLPSLKSAASSVSTLSDFFKSATATNQKFFDVLFKAPKSLSSVVISLGTVSAGLFTLSQQLQKSENSTVKFIGQLSLVASIITGTLTAVVAKAIFVIGDFAIALGTKLVQAAEAASDKFIDFDKKVFVFERTIQNFNVVTDGAIGKAEDYAVAIDNLSKSTGASTKDLRASAAELVATLGPLGFQQEQIQKLIVLSNDYATQIGGDVVQATIDFVGALNGNSQSVIKYGVKLGESTVQQALFKKGLDVNFSALSDTEKVQARYNVLLDKYKPIAGVAAEVSGTLAGQQKLLTANLERLTQEFGRGSSIIENFQLLNFGANLVLSNLNDTVVATSGFLTSLVGRILQIVGVFIKWSVAIGLVVKGFELLQIAIATPAFKTLASTQIPLINKSLTELAKNLGFTAASFTSLSSFSLASLKAIKIGFLQLSLAATGATATSLTFSAVLSGILTKAIGLVTAGVSLAVTSLGALLSAFAAPLAIIAAIAAALFTAKEAFGAVEAQTGAVSTVFQVLKEVLSAVSPLFTPVIDFFSNLKQSLKDIGSSIFGALVAGLSKTVSLFITLLELNPGNIFSKDQIARLGQAKNSLAELNTSLAAASFNISKIQTSGENLGATSGIQKFSEVSIEALNKLKDEIKNVGKSEIAVARETLNERLSLLTQSLSKGLIKEKEASELRKKVIGDFEKFRQSKQDAFLASFEVVAESETDKIKAQLEKQKALIDKAAQDGVISAKKASDLRVQIEQQTTKQLESIAFKNKQASDKLKAEEADKVRAEQDTQNEKTFEAIKSGFLTGVGIVTSGIAQAFALGSAILDGQVFTELKNTLESTILAPISALGSLRELSTTFKSAVFGEKKTTTDPNTGKVTTEIISPSLAEAISSLVAELPTFVAEFVRSFPQLVSTFVSGFPEFIKQLSAAIPVIIDQLVAAFPKVVETLAGGFDVIIQKLVDSAPAVTEAVAKALPRIFASLLDGLTNIIDGAPAVFQKIFENIPSLITSILSRVPQLIRSITAAIPQIVRSFAANLPTIVIAIIEELPEIVQAMVESFITLIPDVIIALVDELLTKGGLARIIVALVEAMPLIAKSLVLGIANGVRTLVPNLASAAGRAFTDTFKNNFKFPNIEVPKFPSLQVSEEAKSFLNGKKFVDKLKEGFEEIFKKLKDALSLNIGGGGGGAKKGPITGIKGSPLSKGGIVKPLYAAEGAFVPRGTDTVPAMLTPGELVVPKNDVKRLSLFLDQVEGGNGLGGGVNLEQILSRIDRASQKEVTVNIQVGEKQLSQVMLNLNRQGFRTA